MVYFKSAPFPGDASPGGALSGGFEPHGLGEPLQRSCWGHALLSRQAIRPRLNPRGYLRESRFDVLPRTACQGGGERKGAIDR